jgi:uncharacterized protein YkwD
MGDETPTRTSATTWVVACLAAIVLLLVTLSVVQQPAQQATTTDQQQSPYKANDPWAAYLAPESVCPGGDDARAAPRQQVATAVCLLNYAREHEHLPPLPTSAALSSAAALKAEDIVACRDVSHTACGKAPDADARFFGLADHRFGENLYWGPEIYQPPRVAVDGWLNSPHHRENLFNADWTAQGVAVLAAPAGFRGADQSEVWVNEFSAP